MTFEKTKVVQNIQTFRPISTGIHVVATTTLVSIRRANCVCATPVAALARALEEQNNVGWIPKPFAHAHSVSGSTQHCFASLEPLQGRQEELHNSRVGWRLRL